ncbi:DUF3015 domain-containing protein [Maricurvus nonylphenolicus]|uniref:DUF3015 domain-containing protein n=1 Tax=Maricurvus nonylphenolicus TaxID=1008307 RepID=UPI0036F2EAB2
MKRTLIGLVLASVSATTLADAAGGNGCGWGNMLFEGQSGKAPHILGITTNGTSGNNTFGVTSGTNGCSSSGTIQYGGKEMVNVSAIMDEFSEDVARGDGEVITAVAVSLGIAPKDRATFKAVMHENFATIFPSESVTTEEVLEAMWTVMKQDKDMAKYFS